MSAERGMRATGAEMTEKATGRQPTFTSGNYEINYIAVAVLCLPLAGALGAFLLGVPLQGNTLLVLLFFFMFNGMIGITVGYHRLFSHRSFEACAALQWLCAFAGAGAFEGSAKWWGRNHRIHHRYVDTDQDPYNARRGFFFSHIGWMIMKQNYNALGKVDVADFKYNRVVQLQHRYFFRIALVSGVLLPTLICGFGWGDWVGGFCYAALAKIVMVHHCTFFINSLAHSSAFGATQNFSDRNTSRDSFVCALFTFGEGYHNFHHEFAQDYRNGIKWYHFDPTKWFIRTAAVFGLARNLIRTPNDIIELNSHRLAAKKARKELNEAERAMKRYEYPVLESWTWELVQAKVAQGRKLMVIKDKVIDLERVIPTGEGYTHASSDVLWYEAHPGGKRLLDAFVGKDATKAFCGGVYAHSSAADSYLERLCVGNLRSA